MEITARSLILDMLTTVRRGAMPVRALIEAGALFGFAENNTRVSLSKLFAEERVLRDERGAYRLAPGTAAISKQLYRWRKLEEQLITWRGDWAALHSFRRGRGAARRRRERTLAVLGFRELKPSLYLRPANLRGGIDDIRKRVLSLADPASLKLDAERALDDLLIYRVRDLDASADLAARNLWDSGALSRGYRSWLARLETSRAGLERLSVEERMVETFVVGGGAVRHLHLDPLLPDAILESAPRRELVAATLEFDELGRSTWAPFMAAHGVPNSGARSGWRAGPSPLSGNAIRSDSPTVH